jgi:hypothetical protein
MYKVNSVFGEDYEALEPAIQAQWDWIDATAAEEDIGIFQADRISQHDVTHETKSIH